MKPAVHAVSVSTAVIAKSQPRGASLQAAWKTTAAKKTFGHDRNSILYWLWFLPLFSLPLIPNSALPFHGIICATSPPFPLKFYPWHVNSSACPFNPFLPSFLSFCLSFFLPCPYIPDSFFFFTSPFSALRSLPPSPAVRQPSSCSPLCIFTRAALPTIRTHYCQLCHLRPPEKQKKKRGGYGTLPMEVGWVCMWWGGGVLYSILDTATKHSV